MSGDVAAGVFGLQAGAVQNQFRCDPAPVALPEVSKQVRGGMDDARAFAIAAHGGQLYGGKPYETHLAAVVQVLCDFGYDETYQQAGWLHDVVEDTSVPLSEIGNRFGETVAELVDAVTGLGPTRRARNARIHAGLQSCPSAAVVKLADRIANVEAAPAGSVHRRRYQREAAMFAKVVRPLVPLAMWRRMERALAEGPP